MSLSINYAKKPKVLIFKKVVKQGSFHSPGNCIKMKQTVYENEQNVKSGRECAKVWYHLIMKEWVFLVCLLMMKQIMFTFTE